MALGGGMRVGTMMAVVLTVASALPAHAEGPSACARLAPQLKMKQVAVQPDGKTPGAASEWNVDLLGGLGKAMFGGTAASTMSVEAAPDSDEVDFSRYTRACVRERVDVACHVTGPARLVVATDKTEAAVDVAPGETIDAGIRKGRRIHCRDLR